MTKEISHIEDIRLLVDTFYHNVRQDELIGAIFNEKIGNRWEEHLNKMYSFWQTILLDEHTYYGRPFPPHASLPIEEKHFFRWIAIFTTTIDELFHGEKAEEAKWRAGQMAKMFQSKIEYFKSLDQKPLM